MKHGAFLFVCVGFLCLVFASGCYASESLEDGLQRLTDEIVRSMTVFSLCSSMIFPSISLSTTENLCVLT